MKLTPPAAWTRPAGQARHAPAPVNMTSASRPTRRTCAEDAIERFIWNSFVLRQAAAPIRAQKSGGNDHEELGSWGAGELGSWGSWGAGGWLYSEATGAYQTGSCLWFPQAVPQLPSSPAPKPPRSPAS